MTGRKRWHVWSREGYLGAVNGETADDALVEMADELPEEGAELPGGDEPRVAYSVAEWLRSSADVMILDAAAAAASEWGEDVDWEEVAP